MEARDARLPEIHGTAPCNMNFQIFYRTFMWVNNMLKTETKTYLQFT